MIEEINTEQILADIEKPSPERPMSSSEGTETPAPESQAPASDWRTSFDWTVDRNGTKYTAESADQAKTWLSLGVNASQRGQELNRQEAEFKRRQAELDQKYKGYDRFAEVDKYVQGNPSWWKFVEEQWAQKGQHQGQIDPSLAPIVNPLLERLQGLEGFVQTIQQEKAQKDLEAQDKALDSEIESIRKANPKIDFSSKDESGRSLEFRVLAHAQENGINSFRAAFRDYLHDKLVEEAKAQSLSTVAQGQTTAVKAGLLGRTPTPTKAAPQISHAGKSWDQLGAEVLKEYGLTS